MISLDFNIPQMTLDGKKFTKTLDRVMGQIIREAAREWLKAVLESVPSRGGFPVLTGAAKSTLVPLGRFLRVAVPVNPTVPAEKRRTAEGEASQQFRIIDDKNNGGSFTYSFEWSTTLLHYFINEFYGYIPYAPWNTVEKGEDAFREYVENALNTRLPNVADYIVISQAPGGGRLSESG